MSGLSGVDIRDHADVDAALDRAVPDTRHLMVDIETLGSRPGAAIASIGAVVFSPERVVAEFECTCQLEGQTEQGLKLDVSTIKWWMQQSDAARHATFEVRGPNLFTALTDLSAFATDHGVQDYWSHGATFDLVLLNEASLILGAPQLVKDFRRARDTRTLYEITDVNPKTFMGTGTAHNAVDDARAQALAVIESWRILRRWKNAATGVQSQGATVFSPWGDNSIH